MRWLSPPTSLSHVSQSHVVRGELSAGCLVWAAFSSAAMLLAAALLSSSVLTLVGLAILVVYPAAALVSSRVADAFAFPHERHPSWQYAHAASSEMDAGAGDVVADAYWVVSEVVESSVVFAAADGDMDVVVSMRSWWEDSAGRFVGPGVSVMTDLAHVPAGAVLPARWRARVIGWDAAGGVLQPVLADAEVDSPGLDSPEHDDAR